MRKIVLAMMFIVACNPLWAGKNKEVDMRYELQATVGQAAEGATIVRVWTYAKKARLAEGEAGRNAVHGIIFKGYPASNDEARISGRDALVNDPTIEEKYAAYFTDFFNLENGAFRRYVSYIGNGTPDQILKVGKEYKVAITVVVMIDQLRKRLEDDGIIKKMAVEGKMPTIMVVPSTLWCNKNGFVRQYNNQGAIETIPDYEKALLNNTELAQTINAINARMAKRGFPLKDLDASLKTLKTEQAEDALTQSKEGSELAESPIDILRRTAKADIWIEVEWFVSEEKNGSQKRLTMSMSALDAYTDIAIGGVSPTTTNAEYASTFQLPIMIETAIQSQFDPFANSLIQYFDRLQKQGRSIRMRILTWEDLEDGLLGEYDGKELSEIIEDWLNENTINGRYGSPDISPSGNRMTIEQVQIPVTKANGKAIDPRAWARELQKMLSKTYGLESNLSTKGLGQVQLIIGGK